MNQGCVLPEVSFPFLEQLYSISRCCEEIPSLISDSWQCRMDQAKLFHPFLPHELLIQQHWMSPTSLPGSIYVTSIYLLFFSFSYTRGGK